MRRMQRRASVLHACAVVIFGTTAVGCAPVIWQETATSSVSKRVIVEEPARLDPPRDVVDVSVDTTTVSDHALVRVSRVVACTSETKERVTVERVRRAEPDPAFIVLDHVALFGGALAAGVGLGVGAGCIGKSSGGCDAALPLVVGGLASEVAGLIGLSVDSAKRRTERIPHEEVRGFGFVTRECARLPVGGVEVSLVPDVGPPASARTDDAGKADVVLGPQAAGAPPGTLAPPGKEGPIDVDLRLDGRSVRRLRFR
jgi:hypothetical protein